VRIEEGKLPYVRQLHAMQYDDARALPGKGAT
jgi:hypothetical protein